MGSATTPTVALLDTSALRAVLDILGAVSLFAVISAAAGAPDAALTTAAVAVLVLVSRALRHRDVSIRDSPRPPAEIPARDAQHHRALSLTSDCGPPRHERGGRPPPQTADHPSTQLDAHRPRMVPTAGEEIS